MSFAEGIAKHYILPVESDFARGIRSGSESDAKIKRRFSEGIEQFPLAPLVERRFSEGIERTVLYNQA